MGCSASTSDASPVKANYLQGKSHPNQNNIHRDINKNDLSKPPVPNADLEPSTEYHNHLHHSAQKSQSNSSLYNNNQFAIQMGPSESYYDLDVNADSKRPGWCDELGEGSGGGGAYYILLERELGMKFLGRLQQHPAIGRLPSRCVGLVSRGSYRGQEVVSVRLTSPEGNRCAVLDCAKLLRTNGPSEFGHVMAYYGTDPIRPMVSRDEDNKMRQRVTYND